MPIPGRLTRGSSGASLPNPNATQRDLFRLRTCFLSCFSSFSPSHPLRRILDVSPLHKDHARFSLPHEWQATPPKYAVYISRLSLVHPLLSKPVPVACLAGPNTHRRDAVISLFIVHASQKHRFPCRKKLNVAAKICDWDTCSTRSRRVGSGSLSLPAAVVLYVCGENYAEVVRIMWRDTDGLLSVSSAKRYLEQSLPAWECTETCKSPGILVDTPRPDSSDHIRAGSPENISIGTRNLSRSGKKKEEKGGWQSRSFLLLHVSTFAEKYTESVVIASRGVVAQGFHFLLVQAGPRVSGGGIDRVSRSA